MSGYERRSGKELTGFIIILVGFSLLMRTMGILPTFPFGYFLQRFWLPALFIGLGVLLLTRRGAQNPSGGILFVILGMFFLMGSMNDVWGFSYQKFIGPAILIWIGIAFLMRSQRGPRERRDPPYAPLSPETPGSDSGPGSGSGASSGSAPGSGPDPGPGPAPGLGPGPGRGPRSAFHNEQYTDSSDYIHATAILGGFNRRYPSQRLRGGNVTAIMGGGKIDLRQARISENMARLNVVTVMGGIEIQVPTDWVIEPRFTPVLGAYVDRTNRVTQGSQTLVIEGTSIMGSITVFN